MKICDEAIRYLTIPILSLFACWVFSFAGNADKLITSTKTYENVFIIEGNNSFYILNPEDGTVDSLPKGEVSKNSVVFDEPEQRLALKNKWREKQTFLKDIPEQEVNKKVEILESNREVEDSSIPLLKKKGNASQYRVSPIVSPNSNLKFAQYYALPGSQYYPGITRKIDKQVTGMYRGGGGMDSLPKVVLRNPPASSAGSYTGGRRMNYGMNASPRYGGMRGSQGGYAPMFRDVTVISNISDLFSTIDDRLVGEFGPLRITPSTTIKSTINSNN